MTTPTPTLTPKDVLGLIREKLEAMRVLKEALVAEENRFGLQNGDVHYVASLPDDGQAAAAMTQFIKQRQAKGVSS